MNHLIESDLALHAAGESPWWKYPVVRLHLGTCDQCRHRVEAYRFDREQIRSFADELPPGVSWDRLAVEMTANIRVGLAAGECVAPREREIAIPMAWRVAGAAAGFVALLTVAWWLNVPKAETVALGRAMKAIVQPAKRGFVNEEAGSLVEASAAGY